MKHYIFLIQLALVNVLVLNSLIVQAQGNSLKIVFDITSADSKVHQSAMRHVSNMAMLYPYAQLEVVLYSSSIDMVLEEKSTVPDEIIKLEDNQNVSFKVCAMTMQRRKIRETQLLPGVGIVPDGILEIIDKQSKGWGYIKESN